MTLFITQFTTRFLKDKFYHIIITLYLQSNQILLPMAKHMYIYIYTVGAKSITRFSKKYVLLRQNISGHRHDRDLWFFCLTGICHRNRIEVKNLKNSKPFFVHVGLNRPKKTKLFFHKKFRSF
jgi:hypothetical protein